MTALLLPPNATELERILADIFGETLDIQVLIETLWNPWACPLPLLPWLAWSFSVDVWDDRWPEQTKRQVIAASFDAHRTKGTRAALERALEPFGFDVEVMEWWQREQPAAPYTFDVTAWVNRGVPATQALQAGLRRTVDAVKPVRAHLTALWMGARFGNETRLAGGLASLEATHGVPVSAGRDTIGQSTGVAGSLLAAGNSHRDLEADGRHGLTSHAALAQGLAGAPVASPQTSTVGRQALAADTAVTGAVASAPVAAPDLTTVGRRHLDTSSASAAALAGLISTWFTFDDGQGAAASSFFVRAEGGPEAEITMRGGELVAIIEGRTYHLAGPRPLPNLEDMIVASSIFIRAPGSPEAEITMRGAELVVVIQGKVHHLAGPRPPIDIIVVGVCDGVEATQQLTFSAPASDLQLGDHLILPGVYYGTIMNIDGNAVLLDQPLPTAIDGVTAYRLRN